MQANTSKDFEQKIKNSRITTTQLRQLLSHAVTINNKITKSGGDKLPENIIDEIHYMLVKFIYQCGKKDHGKKDHGKKDILKEFDEAFGIQRRIKAIGNSKDKFIKFYRYLEEIVAYTKYYRS